MSPAIAALLGAVQEADRWYATKVREAREARSAETAALNALNEAQKAFDIAVKEVRIAASGDSDWASTRRRMTGVTAPVISGLDRP